MISDFRSLKTMGVINITPNSFSDPSKFFLTDELHETLKNNLYRSSFLFDLGFESTAPMNESISAKEELNRFLSFFNQVEDIDFKDQWVSFDTYRVESFRHFEKCLKDRYGRVGVVFNDVSGVLDNELIDFLAEKKNDPFFRYVYCFTHIPSRGQTGKHMTFLRNDNVYESALKQFIEAEAIFKKIGVIDKIIFDPCFGFSKTFEQNWELIWKLPDLFGEFADDRSWLIGLSKKSFLRKTLPPETSDVFFESEKLHASLIEKLYRSKNNHLLFRVHDFDIVERVLKPKESKDA